MMHITNGDAVVTLLQQTVIPGAVLPWRDALHEGPVPAGLDLPDLDAVRTTYLSERGWDDAATIRRSFAERRRFLLRAADTPEIVLWFEHDLYDQLQLIQVLDWLAASDGPSLSLICINAFPGIERFKGLGQLRPENLEALFTERASITQEHLDVSARAWAAFRHPDPSHIEALLTEDPSALPFLGDALRRHLEQFPSVNNGLGRTHRQILASLDHGIQDGTGLFRACDALEEAPFLSDLIFWEYVLRLANAPTPLLAIDPSSAPTLLHSRLTLTDAGRAVLGGRADHIALNGVDGWWGGVHMHGTEAPWRWDAGAGRLHATT